MVVRTSKWSLRIRAWKPARVVSRFVRRVRTASGAVAVQIVTRRGRVVEQVEHLGSARTDGELALLLTAARERLSLRQDTLDLGELPAAAPRLDDVADWTSKGGAPATRSAATVCLAALRPPRALRRATTWVRTCSISRATSDGVGSSMRRSPHCSTIR
jgi:hypothetical protein